MSAQRPSQARLVYERGDGSRHEFELGDVSLIGRDEDADVRLDEPLVSRCHARIERRAGAFVLIDLGSTNWTRVNEEVVRERELRDGDELRFGRARCRFVGAAPSDPVSGGV